MAATRTHVKEQCARIFNSCPILSPKDPKAATAQAKEVAELLLRCCQSDEHVTETVTGFIENALHCENLVAELKLFAAKTQHADAPPPGCDRCNLGEHPTSGEQRWAPHVPGERNGYSMAVRCDCRRGRWLAAQDEKRKAIAQATQANSAKKPERFDDRPDSEAV